MRKFCANTCLVLVLVLIFSIGFAAPGFAAIGQSDNKSQKHGVLGQIAPKFESVEWVGGAGNKIEPVQISDYKGKVVYLLFFQDW